MRRLAALLLLSALSLRAEESPSLFKDPQDGALDLSGWLATRTGFLPVPVPITEPAVGYGAALGLVLFHGGGLASAATASPGPTGRPVPPDISVAGGLATENGTWGAFVAHKGYWGGDRWRYLGALGYVSPNLDYYGQGDRAFGFNVEGWVLVQEMLRRVGKTDLFAGLRYAYFDSSVHFDLDNVPPEIPRPSLKATESGLGLVVQYDTRNNTLTPSSGVDLTADAQFMGPWLGGDHAFERYSATGRFYWDLSPRFVLAARLQLLGASGDVPFYALPFVTLRGIPAMRYQGKGVAAVDGEARWNVSRRWWLVAFAGAGWTGDDLGSLQSGRSVNAGGAGFRYLVARALGLQMGVDVARGPEQGAIYVVAGSSF